MTINAKLNSNYLALIAACLIFFTSIFKCDRIRKLSTNKYPGFFLPASKLNCIDCAQFVFQMEPYFQEAYI